MIETARSNQWLSLSDVAGLLGVHPSTVRNWSDQGVLPVHRTKGGHRRYLNSELELWIQSQAANGGQDASLVVQNALKNTRFQISEGRLTAESWYAKLDDDAREQYRRSGRTLLQGLNDFLVADPNKAAAEAQSLGLEYASRGRRYGLNVTEAVNAFLFFRNVLIESMLAVYEAASVQSPFAWSDMFRKINAFTDQILITLLKTYTDYERSVSR